jgi:D-alanyl-D-alanine carboxypeptidase
MMPMRSLRYVFIEKRVMGVINGVIWSIIILIILVGCARPTGYTKASSSFLTGATGYGYKDKRINGDEFSIVVLGNPSTSKARAAEIALLRAAHLTKKQGRTHFVAIKQKTETTEKAVTISIPLFVGGVFVPVPVGEKTDIEPIAFLLIRVLPPQPAYPPEALNAADVIEQLAKHLE